MSESVRFSRDTDFGSVEIRRKADGTKFVTVDSICEMLGCSVENFSFRLKRFIQKPGGEPSLRVDDLTTAMNVIPLSMCAIGKRDALCFTQRIMADEIAGMTLPVATVHKAKVIPDRAELIEPKPFRLNAEETNAVDGKNLYEFLEVREPFAQWIVRALTGRQEHSDYERVITGDTVVYMISVREAKHISMMENNPKGRWARDYFIEFEERVRKGGFGSVATVELHQKLGELEGQILSNFRVLWEEQKSQREEMRRGLQTLTDRLDQFGTLQAPRTNQMSITTAAKLMNMPGRSDHPHSLPLLLEREGWIHRGKPMVWAASDRALLNGYMVRTVGGAKVTPKGLERLRAITQ